MHNLHDALEKRRRLALRVNAALVNLNREAAIGVVLSWMSTEGVERMLATLENQDE